MIPKTLIIQELTYELANGKMWHHLYEREGMDRDQIFELIQKWAGEFEKTNSTDYRLDIGHFARFCEEEVLAGREVTAESFMQPRVLIGFAVTECGQPNSGILTFPKRGEDMEQGTEYEWYYSLREMTDQILALKIGETIPFKIRDDKNSVGAVIRLK